MNSQEHEIQKAICHYLDLRGVCYWAVPNGGKRHIITAKKLKAEGVKPGVPDITIIHDGLYYGLEVKKPKTVLGGKGRLSLTQKAMIEQIEQAGGEVKVVYSVADVIEACIDWQIKVL
jgi:hypothetical protein